MSILDARTAALKEAAERFKRDTEHHEMTVLHDDELRHLRFERPDRRGYWFSLTTWPHKLTVNGAVGTYVFSCEEDMFGFFRESAYHGGPNIGYWDEKVVASSDPTVDFSTDLFDRHVAEYFAEPEAEKHWPGVTADWAEKTSSFFAEYDVTFEHGALTALRDFTYRPEGAEPGDEPFQFCNVDEWDLRGYDWRYLWSCHAIVRGIGQYDALKAQSEVAEARRVERIRGDISRALALIDEFDAESVSTAEHAKWVEVRNALGGES